MDRLAAVPTDDLAARLSAIAGLREVLPSAEAAGAASARGMLGRLTVVEADAFSLDLRGEGDAATLIPILHRAGAGGAILLPDDRARVFGEDRFHRFAEARPLYSLGDDWVVVLAPPLRRALAAVRRVASGPAASRRALLAAPRAFLREELGDDVDDTVLESVFRETEAWSSRVVGLGLWRKRVLPWVPLATTDWFGPETGGSASGAARPRGGIVVDGSPVPLSASEAAALALRVEAAISQGRPAVTVEIDGKQVELPADHDTLAALHAAEVAAMGRESARPTSKEPEEAEALLIRANEEALDVEGEVARRPASPSGLPAPLATVPKPHQAEGIAWLQRAWTAGLPGVLLADDMGLGKTLQGLAFLAWLRAGMASGAIPRAPVLIVAPTGLLENWRAEHDRHLAAPGLGRLLPAYGRGLAEIRDAGPDGRPALDAGAIRDADWVLTTYETLRDYDRDFGRIRFAALLFDEAQKIKTPGIRLTDAAKAMNADFRVALTGTPVENRLADLWCIVDAVHPGCLDDLKSFSARWERGDDPGRLATLKATLDRGVGGFPPLMLRRMKEDRLPDLPPREDRVVAENMGDVQRAAYDAAVQTARGDARPGAVLEALTRLRAVCLHPDPEGSADDASFIATSARLRVAARALDAIAAAGERALVFLDDLAIQSRLAGVLQRRYRLPSTPMIISGEVSGRARQDRVDRFQSGPPGFDVMLLSPRAGGVGLTLTRANHVIHLSRWWNPAVEDQCTGRVLRIGQERPVTVHIPMAILPSGSRSFDENLHALMERKRNLMRDALLPPTPTRGEERELLERTLDSA
ncbi:DEAD/DEAH box helicase [Muricoccus radiodurans]|uniref:DEAD/DEAH box helicase n=1 Tax=Muricoccus radiodurans TaxID=2231721 RepID=UPI003CF3DF87